YRGQLFATLYKRPCISTSIHSILLTEHQHIVPLMLAVRTTYSNTVPAGHRDYYKRCLSRPQSTRSSSPHQPHIEPLVSAMPNTDFTTVRPTNTHGLMELVNHSLNIPSDVESADARVACTESTLNRMHHRMAHPDQVPVPQKSNNDAIIAALVEYSTHYIDKENYSPSTRAAAIAAETAAATALVAAHDHATARVRDIRWHPKQYARLERVIDSQFPPIQPQATEAEDSHEMREAVDEMFEALINTDMLSD
ncbi:hypothetical protein C8J57DRAFT_1607833, partial [Mycena rebaudengoi]